MKPGRPAAGSAQTVSGGHNMVKGMVALMVIVTVAVFLLVDLSTRIALKRYEEKKARKERERALDIGLRLDYSEEVPSLKRVEVPDPKARILAVDDESIVLESFRKILVLAGYSVDTVETGREAVGLVRQGDYDFVFTDLKMPDMDGLDVTKAVKHLRPDIDVIMITGYATIESAVDAMKFGAMDYVQKPFTANELMEFTDQSLIRRNDRIARQRKPRLHLVTPSSGASTEPRTFNIPAGLFIAPTHLWVYVGRDGYLLVGLDDFALKILGGVDEILTPAAGEHVRKGELLLTVRFGPHKVSFASPASGKVASLNHRALEDPETIYGDPYDRGWICGIEPSDLAEEIRTLRVGAEAIDWYQEEIDRYVELARAAEEQNEEISPVKVLGGVHEKFAFTASSDAGSSADLTR